MKHWKRVVAALSTAALAVCAVLYAPPAIFPYAFGILAMLCLIEGFQLANRLPKAVLAVKALLFVVIAFCFLTLSHISVTMGAKMLLYVIACVKLSDMGGFAFGVLWGRHKMCPSISPNKSWEGMLGSVIGSCLISSLFMPITGFALWKSLLIGVVAAFVGTAGDLVESKFKRMAGVKDSSTFMPAGMGGFLDMFDSLLFAPAVIYLLMKL